MLVKLQGWRKECVFSTGCTASAGPRGRGLELPASCQAAFCGRAQTSRVSSYWELVPSLNSPKKYPSPSIWIQTFMYADSRCIAAHILIDRTPIYTTLSYKDASHCRVPRRNLPTRLSKDSSHRSIAKSTPDPQARV